MFYVKFSKRDSLKRNNEILIQIGCYTSNYAMSLHACVYIKAAPEVSRSVLCGALCSALHVQYYFNIVAKKTPELWITVFHSFCIPFIACSPGTYKDAVGNEESCSACPSNSNSTSPGSAMCSCIEGYHRAKGDTVGEPCRGQKWSHVYMCICVLDFV